MKRFGSNAATGSCAHSIPPDKSAHLRTEGQAFMSIAAVTPDHNDGAMDGASTRKE
jgi:hypothetical protein